MTRPGPYCFMLPANAFKVPLSASFGYFASPVAHAEADEVAGRHAVARRLGAVVLVLAPGEQLLVVVGGEEEAAAFVVAVLLDHRVGQRLRLVEPLLLAGRVVQRQQAVDEEGVVVEVGVAAAACGFSPGAAP